MRTVSSSFSSSSQVSRRLNLREVILGKKSEASSLLFLFVKTEQITTTIDSHAPASNTGRPPRADKEKEEEKRVFERNVSSSSLSSLTKRTRRASARTETEWPSASRALLAHSSSVQMTPDAIESIVGTRARDSRRENRPDGNAPSRRRGVARRSMCPRLECSLVYKRRGSVVAPARTHVRACVHTLQSTNLQIALMIQLPEPDAKSSVIPLGLFRCGF